MPQPVRSFILSLSVLFVSQAAVLAHPGHEHAADRPLVEQLAHPAFGWEVYLALGLATCAAIACTVWRRRSKTH